MGKSFNLFGYQFLYLLNEGNHTCNTYLTELGGRDEKMWVKVFVIFKMPYKC